VKRELTNSKAAEFLLQLQRELLVVLVDLKIYLPEIRRTIHANLDIKALWHWRLLCLDFVFASWSR
jgi:hypothetical protein